MAGRSRSPLGGMKLLRLRLVTLVTLCSPGQSRGTASAVKQRNLHGQATSGRARPGQPVCFGAEHAARVVQRIAMRQVQAAVAALQHGPCCDAARRAVSRRRARPARAQHQPSDNHDNQHEDHVLHRSRSVHRPTQHELHDEARTRIGQQQQYGPGIQPARRAAAAPALQLPPHQQGANHRPA